MDKKYKLTLHIGKHTNTGVASRFTMVAHADGNAPFKASNALIYLLDKKIIEHFGFDLVLDINGVFIPNDYSDKGYTVAEAYKNAMEASADSFINMLKDALTGVHNND